MNIHAQALASITKDYIGFAAHDWRSTKEGVYEFHGEIWLMKWEMRYGIKEIWEEINRIKVRFYVLGV